MSTGTYLLGVVAALVAFAAVVELLRRRRLRERHAVWWFFAAVGALIVGIFPGLLSWAADLLNVGVPANLVFFVSIVILFLVSLQHAGELTDLEDRAAYDLPGLRRPHARGRPQTEDPARERAGRREREERRGLEDRAALRRGFRLELAPERADRLRRGLRHPGAEHLDGALVGAVGADQAEQQGRLAGTVAASQGDGLPRPHLEAELDEDGVGPEGALQSRHLEHGGAFGHDGDSAPPAKGSPARGRRRTPSRIVAGCRP